MFCSFIFSNTVFVFDHHEYTPFFRRRSKSENIVVVIIIVKIITKNTHPPSSANAWPPPKSRTSLSWSSSSTSSPRTHTLLLLPTPGRLQIRGESAVWKAAQPACILFLCVKLVFEITMTLLCFFRQLFDYSKMNKCSKCKSVSWETEMLLKFPQSVPNSKEKFTM